MGEKPLGIDEAPAAVMGGGTLVGGDVAPPEIAAATINTTRSNIKTQGVAAPPVGTGDPAGFAIKEQGVLKPSHPGAIGPSTAVDGDPIPGMDVPLGKPGGSGK